MKTSNPRAPKFIPVLALTCLAACYSDHEPAPLPPQIAGIAATARGESGRSFAVSFPSEPLLSEIVPEDLPTRVYTSEADPWWQAIRGAAIRSCMSELGGAMEAGSSFAGRAGRFQGYQHSIFSLPDAQLADAIMSSPTCSREGLFRHQITCHGDVSSIL